MGWDFKQPHDPSWQCLQCGSTFHHFPWGPTALIAFSTDTLALSAEEGERMVDWEAND